MARIVGIDIPNEKKLRIALRYVYGLGPKRALDLINAVGLDPDKKARDLTEEEVTRINGEIEKNFVVEGQLRRTIISNIQRLKDIRCYRGLRHIRGLPVRGQLTQSNARTRKGPRVTVAGKKK
ncbi:MAG: 30S ribosomal protein S13 [Planctomycetes bacterium]|nr:30S ribosomal protein S13 [Planctomycetota bacterium]